MKSDNSSSKKIRIKWTSQTPVSVTTMFDVLQTWICCFGSMYSAFGKEDTPISIGHKLTRNQI